ncbi:MAG: heavy-metal-associated domain-containing protein [Rhodocyclaceae bacterium]|nr:heavy-metal-associated domain-containing protein [Rhodocyclaceae bacterium]
MDEVVIKVAGMSCQGCVKGVTAALAGVPGVSDAAVDLAAAQARVRFDPARVTVEALRQAVEAAGFEAG